jgi:hypothetical protein
MAIARIVPALVKASLRLIAYSMGWESVYGGVWPTNLTEAEEFQGVVVNLK